MNRHDVMSVSPPTPVICEPSPRNSRAVAIPEIFTVLNTECLSVLIPGTAAVEIPVKLAPDPVNDVAVTTPATDSPVPTIIP